MEKLALLFEFLIFYGKILVLYNLISNFTFNSIFNVNGNKILIYNIHFDIYLILLVSTIRISQYRIFSETVS